MSSPRTLRVLVPAALVALGAIAWSATQGFAPAKPGAQHALLARMAGVWDAKITMYMPAVTESTGTETNVLACGDKWLTTEVDGEIMGMPFEGRGLVGWDSAKKAYVGVWIDTFSESITELQGAYSEENKTLVWDYEQTMMGTTYSMRDVHTFLDADHRKVESFLKSPDGDQKHLQIEFTRRPGGSR